MNKIENKKGSHGYRAVERLLYNYIELPNAINLHEQEIKKLKKELSKMPSKGKSKNLVINDKETCLHYGDDTLEIRINELMQIVVKVKSQIRLIDEALSKIKNDDYFDIIKKYYFDKCTLESIAEYYNTSIVTISNHKKRLINRLKVYLFPSDFINEL